jgi:hypothetical protein
MSVFQPKYSERQADGTTKRIKSPHWSYRFELNGRMYSMNKFPSKAQATEAQIKAKGKKIM